MSATLPPIPTDSPAIQIDANNGRPLPGYKLGQDLYLWLFQFANLVQSAAKLIGTPVQKTLQTAAIVTTPIPLPALTAGLYRVSFYARVTAPAGVSSQLGDFTLGWTDGGVACSAVAANTIGNLTTTVLQGSTAIQIDGATAITYQMGYASNPANAMAYKLTISVESIS